MTQPEIKTIAGRGGSSFDVEIRRLGFSEQKAILVRLAKTVGPSLAAYADAHASLEELRNAQGSGGLAAVVGRFLLDVNEADLDWLAGCFGKASTALHGGKRILLAHSEAREALFSEFGVVAFGRWLAACMEVNFSDFFGELRGLLGDASA